MTLRATALAICAGVVVGGGASCGPPELVGYDNWVPPPPGGPQAAEAPASRPAGGAAGADTGNEPPEARTPSGYLLVSKERLARLRSGAKGGAAAFALLQKNVDDVGSSTDASDSSLENIALMYLITGKKAYADQGWRWYKAHASEKISDDSYLGFGGAMASAAVLLNWCADALTPEQKNEIADYLERSTNELWFANKGSGWGLKDPANNYYYSFVEGTAFAAYALKAMNRPSAAKLVELTASKIEGPEGALAYLDKGAKGGDWEEGANYGLQSKVRMFTAFAAIASMGGPNYFAKSAFPNASVVYAAYQIQPSRRVLAPTGDIAREPTMSVSPFDRSHVQIATYWTDDSLTRGIGAWILKNVAPSYLMDVARLRSAFYRDVLFPTPAGATPPNRLPLHYRSPGTDWVNARSGWDDSATSLTFNGTPEIEQSHAHLDVGSFVLYRNEWQAVDGASYGHSGLNWESGAHNMISAPGQSRGNQKSRGLVHFSDDDRTMYAEIDASKLLMKKGGPNGDGDPMFDEWTRELVYLRPGTLVVYDRVAPRPAGAGYSWRLHFAKQPTGARGRYGASNGKGSIGVAVLDGGPEKIASDADVVDDGKSWRLELGPNPAGRFLALVQVASGPPPAIVAEAVAAPGVEGAAWANQLVVFSTAPLGQPATLPISLTFKDGGTPRQVTLVNVKASCDATIARANGTATVRITAGGQHAPNEHGLVQFSL